MFDTTLVTIFIGTSGTAPDLDGNASVAHAAPVASDPNETGRGNFAEGTV